MRVNAPKLAAFVCHGFARAISYRLNFVTRYVSAAVAVIFFFFLDKLFQQSGIKVVEEGEYFAFLLIGGAFSRYLDLTMRSFAENLREEMLRGTLEPLLVTATPAVLVLLGPVAWMLIEGTLLALFQLVIGAFLGADFSRADWLSTVVVSVVSLSSLMSYGILSAAFIVVFKRSDPLNWLMRSTAYLFGGVFFPITIMPPFLRVISYLLPFTYAIDGLRGALMRGDGIGELGGDIAALLGITIVLLPLSVWALKAAIRYTRRTGQLLYY